MNHYPPRIGPPAGAPSQRLNELLDQIRAEFETESNRSVDYEGQSEYTRSFRAPCLRVRRPVYILRRHERRATPSVPYRRKPDGLRCLLPRLHTS
jgi:hypothetical protein